MNAKHHQNLFAPLFKIAFDQGHHWDCDLNAYIPTRGETNVIGYHSDLGWDAITLSRSKEGDVFLWGWRENGSHIVKVNHERTQDVVGMLLHDGVKPCNWHIIRVTKKHAGADCAEGTIESPNYFTRTELVRHGRELLEEHRMKSEPEWKRRLLRKDGTPVPLVPRGWSEVEGGEESQ